MKALRLILPALFLASSLLAQDVSYNFDSRADFSKYKTYRWEKHPQTSETPRTPRDGRLPDRAGRVDFHPPSLRGSPQLDNTSSLAGFVVHVPLIPRCRRSET